MREFKDKTEDFVDNFLAKYEHEEVTGFLNQRILAEIEAEVVVKYIPFRRFFDFAIAASVIFSFLSGIFLSNLTLVQSDNNFQIGEESLYTYFVEGE
ncbi:MAG: hypothetical protein HN952_07010 [Candidatus Cloacimonetes bacterium]|jgi:hypothetical protein|nr:hypothetical protein [Candidatus Cloacimonadota bacterium]MBT6994683.1 hypothetical protein [Candidatus Cloacimonadota bacterium]MBT7469497.1 hypothetical protein [Candidatus Cloacimonadota bacterium]